MENEIKERKEREYFIIHINYSTNRYYIYMYHRFRKFTINQAWDYINNDDNCILFNIEGSGNIGNKNEEQILDQIHNLYFEPREEKNPLKRTVILRTITVSDEEGNDIKKEYPAEIKSDMEFEEHINKILNGEAQEDINDSAAIQQEDSDKEKDIIEEDFVNFEKDIKNITHLTLLSVIDNYFPCCKRDTLGSGKVSVVTRLGTIFTVVPTCWFTCNNDFIIEHDYEVSLCII